MYSSISFGSIIVLSLIELSLSSSAGVPGRIPILMNSIFKVGPVSGSEAKRSPEDMNQWNCRFDSDFCGLTNAYNMAQFQRYSESRFPMFGETSMLYINSSIVANFQAARLESDYFTSSFQPFGCLSIRYLMYGTGASKLFVVQQDIRNRCLWVDANPVVDNRGQWRDAKLTIDLRNGSPRFFIEAHMKSRAPNNGTIAISHMAFGFGVCPYDQTNACQSQFPTSIPIEPTPA